MNKQYKKNKDGTYSRSIEWTHYYGAGSGYTWNPIAGCVHDCKWTMPDGNIASCYAGEVADRFHSDKVYPQGFAHHYWNPELLKEPIKHKTPAGIFAGSMSDVFGATVPADQIQQVLDVIEQCPQHVFFLLTKNAPRLDKFSFPANAWVGVSMPPSFMFGKALTPEQKLRYLQRSYESLERIKGGGPTWLSIEPLSWNVAPDLENAPVSWAVIGAASNGRTVYQPEPVWVKDALSVLDSIDCKVFYKGNIRGNAALKDSNGIEQWREEYPPY